MSVTLDVEERPPPVQLVFDDVSIEVPRVPKSMENPTITILDGVSGTFGPGEAIAVMGPSGSGKTTMLNALTGVQPPTSGTISVNGEPFDRDTVRSVSAFVPQDDLLTPVLSVHEAMMEACAFKSSLPVAARCESVDVLLRQFDLGAAKNVLVGNPASGKKGISGWQRRRLSVALELCGSPSLLYLDEPTSGLDAVSAMALVRLLSTLASSGVTVITTIHQPSAILRTSVVYNIYIIIRAQLQAFDQTVPDPLYEYNIHTLCVSRRRRVCVCVLFLLFSMCCLRLG